MMHLLSNLIATAVIVACIALVSYANWQCRQARRADRHTKGKR